MHWADRIGRRLKLRDMHILMSVAQRGSMARAAAELAISQPAVSKAIADMEHTLACVYSIEAVTESCQHFTVARWSSGA